MCELAILLLIREKAILQAERSILAIEHLKAGTFWQRCDSYSRHGDQVTIDDSLQEYMIQIVNRTRTSKWLELGASPRGTLALQRAARASALVAGRRYCLPDDIKALAVSVLAHRVMLQADTFTETFAEDAERVIRDIVAETPVPL